MINFSEYIKLVESKERNALLHKLCSAKVKNPDKQNKLKKISDELYCKLEKRAEKLESMLMATLGQKYKSIQIYTKIKPLEQVISKYVLGSEDLSKSPDLVTGRVVLGNRKDFLFVCKEFQKQFVNKIGETDLKNKETSGSCKFSIDLDGISCDVEVITKDIAKTSL